MFRNKYALIEVLVAFCIILDTSSFVRGAWNECDYVSTCIKDLLSDVDGLKKGLKDVKNDIHSNHQRDPLVLETTPASSGDEYRSLVTQMKSMGERILELEEERDERKKQQQRFPNSNNEYLVWKNKMDQISESLAEKDKEIKALKNNIIEVETDLQLEREGRKELQEMLENLNNEYLQWKTVIKRDLADKDAEINTLKRNFSAVETKLQTEHNERKRVQKYLKSNTDDIQNISISLLSFDKNVKEFQWNLQNMNGTLQETYSYYKLSEKELKFYGEWRHEVLKDFNNFKTNLETINQTATETKTDLEKYVEASNSSLKTLQDKTSLQEKRIENFENNLQNINISMKILSDNMKIRYKALDEQLKANQKESSHSFSNLIQELYILRSEVRYDIEPRVKEAEAEIETLTKRRETSESSGGVSFQRKNRKQ